MQKRWSSLHELEKSIGGMIMEFYKVEGYPYIVSYYNIIHLGRSPLLYILRFFTCMPTFTPPTQKSMSQNINFKSISFREHNTSMLCIRFLQNSTFFFHFFVLSLTLRFIYKQLVTLESLPPSSASSFFLRKPLSSKELPFLFVLIFSQ